MQQTYIVKSVHHIESNKKSFKKLSLNLKNLPQLNKYRQPILSYLMHKFNFTNKANRGLKVS